VQPARGQARVRRTRHPGDHHERPHRPPRSRDREHPLRLRDLLPGHRDGRGQRQGHRGHSNGRRPGGIAPRAQGRLSARASRRERDGARGRDGEGHSSSRGPAEGAGPAARPARLGAGTGRLAGPARRPCGKTVTYGQIAKALPLPATAQEVGAACAANVLAVAVPCHRVVKADGSISGYRWGVRRKRTLIEREAAA
jgi:O-6-methylguanine DNA methyltransferase